jgi:hypothetical protein
LTENELENSGYGFSLHYAIWKPSGRLTAFGDFGGNDANILERFALDGRFVGYAAESFSHETLERSYAVYRMNVQSGRREEVPPPDSDLSPGEAPPAWAACGRRSLAAAALVVTDAGTVAWIQGAVVCELPHGSATPLLLATSRSLRRSSLRWAHGHLTWREGGAVRSVPLT